MSYFKRLLSIVSIVFCSTSLLAQSDREFGPGYQGFETNSSGSASAAYERHQQTRAVGESIDYSRSIDSYSQSSPGRSPSSWQGSENDGGYSGGSGRLASNIFEAIGTLTNPATYTEFYNDVRTLVTAQVQRMAPITYGAASAGLESLGEMPSGTSEGDYERAFYRGAHEYYEINKIDPYDNFVPIGPVQRIARYHYDMSLDPSDYDIDELYAENASEETKELRKELNIGYRIKIIDSLYRGGDISIYYDGMISRDTNISKFINSPGLSLNDEQLFGLDRVLVITGSRSSLEQVAKFRGHAISFPDIEKAFLGGTIYMPNDHDLDEIRTHIGFGPIEESEFYDWIFGHELQHAGDLALKNHSRIQMNNPQLPKADREKAKLAHIYSSFVLGGLVTGALSNDEDFNTIADISSSFVEEEDYINSFAEFRAWTTATNVNAPGFVDIVQQKFGVNRADAEVIESVLKNSVGIQKITDFLREYAKENR